MTVTRWTYVIPALALGLGACSSMGMGGGSDRSTSSTGGVSNESSSGNAGSNNTGFTAVHLAIEAGAVDALTLLLGAGADLTIAARGVTPTETARRLGNARILALLQGTRRAP